MSTDPIDILKCSSLFRDVEEGRYDFILNQSLNRSVEEDGYFFMQGDAASHAYVLLEGRVKMLQLTTDGHQIALRLITPGQTFGGIALLNPPNGYPVSALALENSTALAWDTATL